jgi:hypothetical protein
MCAANDCESDCTALLCLGDLLCCAWGGFTASSSTAELFCVGKNEVHVLWCVSFIHEHNQVIQTLSNASICPTICLPS